ncbi:MAG TPA: hypothetical protein DEE98_00205 [Elusimicrobia bacterium]|nr:MAG: hypothetical protein A2278_08720 [Elusimicrobia bacterium RIFOXYA12_FULL_49_49]OGS07804.1 MAG: hypothetical protein A2204_04830 [Elusimicrobia bacterium RIFOXYA1_FULL_47_7]OGS14790.1 MAG: hypothetical protein A2251_09875 [Elusimicrobia bacterium RIFOXYA2_FULL_47_53]OGS25560.1 MAG: hypothetical protein A2339_05720 [Elusimicrobia bacterium RIFOXYB12_FULL_50_12]OGS28926.1 MAG: hypothetical protein A2323_05150 [Elusimicrobia bacterium RIFOXYB2_FULL_46_23]HBU68787.1 hypothetical protein [El
MRLRLFPKFTILLTLLAVIPAAIVGVRTMAINREGMQVAILELHTNIAASLADHIKVYLENLDNEILFVSKTMVANMSWADRQSVIQSLLDTNENFVSVSIVDRKGQELLKAYNPALEKDPKLLSRKDDEAFIKFWKDPARSSISPSYYFEEDPRINVIYPLGPGHCLYTTISLKNLWDKITKTKISATGHAFLVNDSGEIIAHPKTELAKKKTSAAYLPIVRQVIKAVSVGSSEFTDPQKKKEMVGAYAPIKSLGWGVVMQQDKNEAFVSVRRMRKQSLLLIILSMAGASVLAAFLAGGLVKPLVTLTKAAKHIASKDFSVRVDVKTKDEIQDLAETFNEMTSELSRYDKMQVDKIVEEKSKTEAVIFSIADGILMTDKKGCLQLANSKALETLGIPENEWHGKSIFDFVSNPSLVEIFKNIVDNPKAEFSREVDLSVGELNRFFQLSAQQVISRDKLQEVGVVTVLRNITLEKELNQMKDDFLHSITHDLRNPMTSVRGFLRFLIDGVAGPLNEQQKKMLETMDRASTRLMGLINDILDIAKLESGRMVLSLAEIDLSVIARRTIELAEGQALKKNIQLKLETQDGLPRIAVDPDLIERVFTNLVGNSLKFTPENGTITIKFEYTQELVKTSIVDTGEGIPAEYVTKIFDKFQQVAGQRKGGTGLGLTICKHVVEAHFGKIWAESAIGKGSSFIFTLPRSLTVNDLLAQSLKTKQ